MVQATTPTFILTLPDTVDLTLAKTIVFTITQGSLKITKTEEYLTYTEHVVSVYFTQEETLKFTKGTARLQLNWVYPDGKRACSNIATVNVTPNLLPEVIQ